MTILSMQCFPYFFGFYLKTIMLQFKQFSRIHVYLLIVNYIQHTPNFTLHE